MFIKDLVWNLFGEGNDVFREGEWTKSIEMFTEALNIADYAESEDICVQTGLLEKLYANRAAAYLNIVPVSCEHDIDHKSLSNFALKIYILVLLVKCIMGRRKTLRIRYCTKILDVKNKLHYCLVCLCCWQSDLLNHIEIIQLNIVTALFFFFVVAPLLCCVIVIVVCW